MKAIGALFGFLVMLVAIPLLSAMIMAAGTTRVALTPKFISDIPREVIKQLPDIVDQTFEAAKKPDALRDRDAKIWVDAISKTKPTPSELFKQIGLYSWLQKELDGVFADLGKVMRGDGGVTAITLDFRPLKQAFTGIPFRTYVTQLIGNLPACSPIDQQRWTIVTQRRDNNAKLPPCNPGAQSVQTILDHVADSMKAIPDMQPVLRANEVPNSFGVTKLAGVGAWLLLLIPAFMIMIAAAMGGTGGRGFLRWSGVATLLGGLAPLAGAWFFKEVALKMLKLDPSSWHAMKENPFWTHDANRILTEKTAAILDTTLTPVMSSIFLVSAIVTGIGVMLLFGSFFAADPNAKPAAKTR
ncbi:MAG: hypothetical protein KC609_11190 [Myxococcales bacterium]|nr:hypothetical protein [Myxococcales bacterium]